MTQDRELLEGLHAVLLALLASGGKDAAALARLDAYVKARAASTVYSVRGRAVRIPPEYQEEVAHQVLLMLMTHLDRLAELAFPKDAAAADRIADGYISTMLARAYLNTIRRKRVARKPTPVTPSPPKSDGPRLETTRGGAGGGVSPKIHLAIFSEIRPEVSPDIMPFRDVEPRARVRKMKTGAAKKGRPAKRAPAKKAAARPAKKAVAKKAFKRAAKKIKRTVKRSAAAAPKPPVKQHRDRVARAEARLTQAWLTAESQKEALDPKVPLEVGSDYRLNVAITPHKLARTVAAGVFPDEAVARWFEQAERLAIDVRLFADPREFAVPIRSATLTLPRTGASDTIAFSLQPLRAGNARARLCLYHRGVLLQSLLVKTDVVDSKSAKKKSTRRSITLDFIADASLDLADDLPRPILSLFANRAADGTHWIGAFAQDPAAAAILRDGELFTFDDQSFTERAKELREKLDALRTKEPYPYSRTYGALDDDEREEHARNIVELACFSYERFFDFFRTDAASRDASDAFRKAAEAPGIVSVARLVRGSTTLPWAVLYDLHLDTVREDEISLCSVFRSQLADNKWKQPADAGVPEDLGELATQHDMLDDPVKCRQQSSCPLNDPAKRDITVCPFGFWGFRHQIDLPLQQIEPVEAGKVPPEVEKDVISQGTRLLYSSGDKAAVRLGFDPQLKSAKPHSEWMKKQLEESAKATDAWDRTSVLAWLNGGGSHVVYLYCDGVLEKNRIGFRFGKDKKDLIIASSLGSTSNAWARPGAVLLNACGSMAMSPERIDGFLAVLRDRGALGVLGTETPVFDRLARPFGSAFVQRILEGRTFGAALLDVRRHMLRHGNPLGLTYTLHGAANLHLHPESGACAVCG